MPRGGYDCTGAAPGSFASRLGRQMYPCGGGNTPRASQAAVFPGGVMPYQSAGAAGGPHAYAQGQQQAVNMSMGYGYSVSGAPQHSGFMPQQQQHHPGAYMAGHGFAAPSQHQQAAQMQAYTTHYGYAPSSMQGPAAAATTPGFGHHPGLVYAGGAQGVCYPQQPSVYGGSQGPYYRHP